MKTCPHCGAEISDSAKYCSECGYNFGSEGTCAKARWKDFWFKLIPNIMFLVFAVLLFAVYAEPVISGLISANVYLLFDSTITNVTVMSAVAILLVVFAVLTLIAAMVTATLKYFAYKENKPINCKTDWISFGCYLLYAFVGIVICIIIASNEHLIVGACSVWLIVLSIIFACLFGALYVYSKYSAAVTEIEVKLCKDSVPTNQKVEQAKRETESKENSASKPTVNREEEGNSQVTTRSKKHMTLLPAILFLIVAVIMWGIYLLPSIRYYDYEDFDINLSISIFNLNFTDMGDATVMFINVFQYALIGYLAIVSVAAVILLIWEILHIKRGDAASVNIYEKALLITLVFYSIFFVLSLAMLLFTMMGRGAWFEVGCIVIIAVTALCTIGTIIAMVKIKKKQNVKVAE